MDRQQILDKILKVKALADRGSNGEKANAERMLKELMEKYHITDEDIQSDKVELFLIDTESDLYIQLLVQICNSIAGHDLKIQNIKKTREAKKAVKELSQIGYGDATANIAVECTKAQFVEIKIKFDIYKEDMKRQLDIFMYAYFSKNNLLAKPKEGTENKKPTQEEIDKVIKATMMAHGIDKKEILKMLENKKE